MSERFKYTIHGVYKCEDFAQHLAAGQFPEHYIGSVPWGFRFYITFKTREGNNQVYPYIACNKERNMKIRAFFNIKSKFWSLCYKTEGSIYLESNAGVSGPYINIQDVLNDENGYLENGALIVEYGFHVDAIMRFGSIWAFNLSGKLFNWEQKNNTTILKFGPFAYHSPKPLLAFHSPLFDHETGKVVLQYKIDGYFVPHCLQIASGVRVQASFPFHSEWFTIAEIGRKLNMMNVVHYCDTIFVRTSLDLLNKRNNWKTAIKLNMRQTAPHIIRLWNFKELLQELENDLDEIPGEMMKVIIKRFFKEEF